MTIFQGPRKSRRSHAGAREREAASRAAGQTYKATTEPMPGSSGAGLDRVRFYCIACHDRLSGHRGGVVGTTMITSTSALAPTSSATARGTTICPARALKRPSCPLLPSSISGEALTTHRLGARDIVRQFLRADLEPRIIRPRTLAHQRCRSSRWVPPPMRPRRSCLLKCSTWMTTDMREGLRCRARGQASRPPGPTAT